MMEGFSRLHLLKVVVMIIMMMAISVMLSTTPERYVYGGF
jgi:hypothetical protein